MTTVMATVTATATMVMAAVVTTTAAKRSRSALEPVTLFSPSSAAKLRVRTFLPPRGGGRESSRCVCPGLWVALGSALALAGCAPKPSSTPLGVGPLALSEHEADVAEARAAQKKAARKPSARQTPKPSAAVAPAAALDAESDDSDDDETPAERSKASSGDDEKKGFVGLYSGKDLAIFRITGVPERQELDEHARLRIESEAAGSLLITLINSENGSDLCQLNAEVQGNTAQLESDQPCFTSEEEGAIHAQLTSGKVVLTGDRLRMDAEGTLSVTLGEEELGGDLSYSFKGDRQ